LRNSDLATFSSDKYSKNEARVISNPTVKRRRIELSGFTTKTLTGYAKIEIGE
jgi:hypothetical protein